MFEFMAAYIFYSNKCSTVVGDMNFKLPKCTNVFLGTIQINYLKLVKLSYCELGGPISGGQAPPPPENSIDTLLQSVPQPQLQRQLNPI